MSDSSPPGRSLDSEKVCISCHTLFEDIFNQRMNEIARDMGPFNTLVERSRFCSFCNFVLTWLKLPRSCRTDEKALEYFSFVKIMFSLSSKKDHAYINLTNQNWELFNLRMILRHKSEGIYRWGRQIDAIPNLDPRVLDTSAISKLLGDDGAGSEHTELSEPMILNMIDVVDLCLVRKRSTEKYFTLSYVWGGHDMLQLTEENWDVLKEKGAFQRFKPARVVIDTIELTKSIGARYLWVDSLSIMQNSPSAGFYIDRMAQIYSSSALTIVAFSGEGGADSLPGVRLGSRLPLYYLSSQGIRFDIDLSELEIASMLDRSNKPCREVSNPCDYLCSPLYETRAWTYQERLLAQRCLILTEFGAALSTSSGILFETREIKSKTHWANPLELLRSETAFDETLTESGTHNATLCRHILCDYTKRNLTYDKDILRAFAGISQALSCKSFRGNVIFGLPTWNFALALTWICFDAEHERRLSCTCPSTRRELYVPSWSWASHKGPISWPPPCGQGTRFEDKHLELEGGFHQPVPELLVTEFMINSNQNGLWEDIENVSFSYSSFNSLKCVLRFRSIIAPCNQFKIERAPFRDSLVLLHNKHNTGFWSEGGLIYDLSLSDTTAPDLALVELAYWNCDTCLREMVINRQCRVYFLLIIRWRERARNLGERVGVAVLDDNVWTTFTKHKVAKTIHLI